MTARFTLSIRCEGAAFDDDEEESGKFRRA